jgi:RNA polymerase sigma-70 factor (ECF subfamily)
VSRPVDTAPRDDLQLVAACRAGDESAWGELVERYSSYVYAIAVRGFRLDEHAAEDLFQEVFARIYERLDQLRDPSSLRSWIGQLTRRLALDQLRRRAEEPLEDETSVAADEDAIAEIESALTVQQILAELPEPFQEILDRFFARGESYRKIGAALDLPPGTIASRISRGLEKLRVMLAEEDSPPGSRP